MSRGRLALTGNSRYSMRRTDFACESPFGGMAWFCAWVYTFVVTESVRKRLKGQELEPELELASEYAGPPSPLVFFGKLCRERS